MYPYSVATRRRGLMYNGVVTNIMRYDLNHLISGYINIYSLPDNNPFFAPIPFEYIRSKDKLLSICIDINELSINKMMDVTKIVIKNVRYTVYIKVRYCGENYFMAGSPFTFFYESH